MTKTEIRDAVETFIANWNRSDWMAEHGEWAEGGDYIEEGTIDPDSAEADAEDLAVGQRWQGWDCHEGWRAYRSGDRLVVNWWRTPYTHTARHERDLWVVVDDTFFEDEAGE